MTFDPTTGIMTTTDLDYWRQQIFNALDQSNMYFNTNTGTNLFVVTSAMAAGWLANESQAALTQQLTLQQINESKIEIEGSKSVTPSGIRSAFLSLAPLVQKCSIIQATRDNEDWYIFLELNKPFGSVTSEEKEILLEMGASKHGCGKLSSKYPDGGTRGINPSKGTQNVIIDVDTGAKSLPPYPIVTIEGEGMIDASYQKKGVYVILNEIQKTQMPPLLIKVTVLQGFEDSVHYNDDRLQILNNFEDNFAIMQGIKVDFLKVDYAPIIHNDERKEWMYDFNFYDNTDPDNPVIQNHIIVNEYEYLTLGTDDPVKISFYTQGEYIEGGEYIGGELIA